MEFRVLGPIEVWDGQRPVPLGPRMPKAVLAVLLLEPGRVVSLDRLIDLLWGDQPPAAATSALQVYVSGLRRALEPDRPAKAPATVLVTQPPGYALRIEPGTVDAVRFEELVTAGRDAVAGGDAGLGLERLRAGLGLWRGPPYAELTFEPFLQVEIARLQELHASAWEAAMEAELALGRHGAVIAELERLVAEDPVRERRWELLALALYRDGRQGEALRTLQRARSTLGEELGVEPGPSLRQLEDGILQQAPSLVPAAVAPVRVVDSPPPRPERPLVGREAEVAELVAAFEAARGGDGRVVLLAGEPGIGKSRLVEELGEVAADRGAAVAFGRCHEGDAAPAYWPWIQVIRSLLSQSEPAAVRRALAVGAEELAQIVPDVKEVAGRDLEPLTLLEPEMARARLYDAIVGFMLRLSADRPLVVVIDDLHWADPPSLQLVALLADSVPTAPVLLACTYRDFQGDMPAPALNVVGALARVPGAVRIRPQALTEDDVGRLISNATGVDADPSISRTIRARTEGNPFFVTELVRLLQAERHLRGGEAERVGDAIPSEIRDVVRLRVARLPEETVSLLRVAAVAGREFDVEIVSPAARLDEDMALERIEAALLIGLVVEHADVPGRYRFSHTLVRDTLYQELSGLRRARVHRAVADALARRAADDDTVEIAHHYRAAASLDGGEQAYEWARRAATRARQTLAFEQGEQELVRAVELANAMPAGPDACRKELGAQLELATVRLMTHGYSAAEVGEAWARAVDLAHAAADVAALHIATWGAWSHACVRGDFSRALHLAERLLDESQRTDNVEARVVAHQALGATNWHLGRLADALGHLDRLGELCRSVPDAWYTDVMLERDPRCAHFVFSGVVLCLMGRTAEGADAFDAAVVAAKAGGRPYALAVTQVLVALGRAMAADRAGAVASSTEAVAEASRHGFRLLEAMARVVGGWAQGDAAAMRQALDGYEAAGARMLLPLFLGLLAEVEQADGRLDEAGRCVERALAAAESTGERFWEADLYRLRGELLLASPPDGWDLGHEAFELALSVARGQGARLLEVRVARSLRRSIA